MNGILYYKWNLEDFKKVFYENNLKSTLVEKNNSNCAIVLVDNFEEMHALFHGRCRWAIAYEKRYWDAYVSEKGRKQYVYADFNKDEKSPGRLFAFTYDPNSFLFTDAATSDNFEVQMTYASQRNTVIRYILEHVFSLCLENFIELETPSEKMMKEISELESKYGIQLEIK